MSDAVVGALLWPVITLLQYLRFVVGCVVCLPLLLFSRGNKNFLTLFANLNCLPLGRYVFSGIVCFYAPYTSSISATVQELSASGCRITMRDWPWLRNPFSSIHAIALANFGEFNSGLLMVALLQNTPKLRGIPIKLTTEYYKKARGCIRAVCTGPSELSAVSEPCDLEVTSLVYDSNNDLLCKTTVCWTITVKEHKEHTKKGGKGGNGKSDSASGKRD